MPVSTTSSKSGDSRRVVVFGGSGGVGSAITRADIATLLLEQLGDSRFIRAAPAISN